MDPITPQNIKQLWENVLVEIELSISKANFTTWFKDTHIARYDDGTIVIGVPNQFAKEWVSKQYHNLILKTLRKFSKEVRGTEYIVAKYDRNKKEIKHPHPHRVIGELPLKEYYINRVDNLNPRYTFESFVVGPFNEFAHAASQAVVEGPGIAYNPLFIYGDTGFGKTHLTQAIGNQLKKRNPQKKIFYVTSEKFGNDYTTSLQNNSVNAFKEKYRQYDVLIMDDIQFLSRREKIQEELFHVFNTLYDNNKQIIFSSDKHPNHIPDIADRLKSRFAHGMIVDISAPDHDSRVAILHSKAKQNSFVLPNDVADYLANSIKGSVRDLEGVLNAVVCHTQLRGKVPSINELRELIKESMRPKKTISTKEVVQKVAELFNVDEQLIYEKTRKKEIVRPRQLIMYVLREDFHISYPTIGQRLGGRDHTTVIHSCEKIKRELSEGDQELQEEIQHIRTLLK